LIASRELQLVASIDREAVEIYLSSIDLKRQHRIFTRNAPLEGLVDYEVELLKLPLHQVESERTGHVHP